MPYRNKIRCYSCHKPVKDTLYIEREVNPYAYVPICENCAPTWHLIKDLKRRQFIEYIPSKGIRLTSKGKCVAKLLKDYKKS